MRYLGQPLVRDGREVEGSHHHLRTPGVVQRLGDTRERARDVRVQRDRAGRRTHYAAIPRAQVGERLPPGVVPGRGAPGLPLVEIGVDARPGAARKRPERAAVQVHRVPEDRKLFTIPYGERGWHRAHGHRVANIVRYLVCSWPQHRVLRTQAGRDATPAAGPRFPWPFLFARPSIHGLRLICSGLPGPSGADSGGPGSPGFRFPTRTISAGVCTPPTETRRRYLPRRMSFASPAGGGRRCTCKTSRSSSLFASFPYGFRRPASRRFRSLFPVPGSPFPPLFH